MFRLLGLALCAIPQIVLADCQHGDPNALEITSWSAAANPNNSGLQRVTFLLKSNLDKPTVMTKGVIRFYDALDRKITGFPLHPDLHIPANGVLEDSWQMNGMERLVEISPSLVRHEVCLTAVVYEDGEVVEW